MPLENEVKIRISNVQAFRRRLRDLGYRIHARRVFESNTLFDTPDGRLCDRGELIRVRRAGRETLLTFKGTGRKGPHKSREEIETNLGDADSMDQILRRLGLNPAFRYEKYRTEYSRRGSSGTITVDETPIGDYIELEGAPKWIDATARKLGYSPSDYITSSYGALYLEHCHERGVQPSNMVFKRPKRGGR